MASAFSGGSFFLISLIAEDGGAKVVKLINMEGAILQEINQRGGGNLWGGSQNLKPKQ